jgi:hypothetical protein
MVGNDAPYRLPSDVGSAVSGEMEPYGEPAALRQTIKSLSGSNVFPLPI